MTGQAWYSTAVVVLLVTGFVPAIVFISQHRPRQWRRMAAWDASGWVILVALWYFRSIVLVWTRWPGAPLRGPFDVLFSIGLLVVLDALLILRVVSYRSFAQRDAERIADGRDNAIT
jgi:hypothetical protein